MSFKPQDFGLLVLFNKLVKAHLFRLYLLHFIKASPHINSIFINDSFIAGLAPPAGVAGVNEVAPPG